MQDDMGEYMIYEKFLQTCQQVRRLLLGKNTRVLRMIVDY